MVSQGRLPVMGCLPSLKTRRDHLLSRMVFPDQIDGKAFLEDGLPSQRESLSTSPPSEQWLVVLRR